MSETKYVCGFAFDRDRENVVLIKKVWPEWQAGRWNGVGGHIETGESPLDAMKREFAEEAGLYIPDPGWKPFAEISDCCRQRWHCTFFRAFDVPLHAIRTLTDEEVHAWRIRDLPQIPTIGNLQWLIPLAVDRCSVPLMYPEIPRWKEIGSVLHLGDCTKGEV